MAYNFRAGQYERAFAPKTLCNWGIPRWYPARPRSPGRRPKPVFLADDRGHLLPGVRRGAPAWKDYPSAWDYPRRITREKIKELTQEPPPGRYLDWLPHVNKPPAPCPEDIVKQSAEIAKGQNEKLQSLEYQPGSLTNPKQRVEAPPLLPPEASLQELCDEREHESGTLEKEKRDDWETEDMKDTKQSKRNGRDILPDVNYIPGFQYARKMHMDNLLHQPLPDTMAAKIFSRQKSKSQQDIDIKPYSTNWIRNGYNSQRPVTSSGIPGASKPLEASCTQRPATSGNEKNFKCITPMNLAIQWDFRTKDPREEPKRTKHIDGSNGSSAPAVFAMVHSPSQGPDNVKDDIGKSNAIFSQNIPPDDYSTDRIVPRFDNDMSKNRRKESCDVPKCKQHLKYEKNRSPSADRNHKMKEERHGTPDNENNNNEKNMKRSGSCDGIHGCGSSYESQKGSVKSGSLNRRKIKNAWTESEDVKRKDNINNNNSSNHFNNNGSLIESFNKGRLHQSSPNLSKEGSNKSKTDTSSHRTQDTNLSSKLNHNNRSCLACDHKNDKTEEDCKKPEYKMAFKAGKPNSNGGSESKSSETNSKATINIPKMKDPYSKKSYAIPTLAPPFSRWKDCSGYPEHWRLASIYQHAYKHPEARKHALLPAVFH